MMELLIQNKVKLTANSLPTVDFSFSILGDHIMEIFLLKEPGNNYKCQSENRV